MTQSNLSEMLPNVQKLVNTFNWSNTSLGDPSQWSPQLHHTLNIILNTPVPMVTYWGPEFVTLYNDAYATLIADKHPALFGRPLFIIWPERKHNFSKIAKSIYQGKNVQYISDYHPPNHPTQQTIQKIEISCSPIKDNHDHIIGIFSIVTDTYDSQSQSIESLEQLIGGLAHDFNTLLGGIIGNLELMDLRIQQGKLEMLPRYIQSAQVAASQATLITNQLLSFSRRQTLVPHITDPNHTIQTLTDHFDQLSYNYFNHKIDIEIQLTPHIWPVFCDLEQFKNALTNIFINAYESIYHMHGKIIIKTENLTVSQHDPLRYSIKPNDYVKISVIDNGSGMDENTIERAIQPFFTTKPLGKRAGLGLSMTYGFLKQSGGYLLIDSAPDQGTTINLFLPRHHRSVTIENFCLNSKESTIPSILIISKDRHLRMILSDNLEELGHIATVTQTEEEAIALLKHNHDFRIIIIDARLLANNNKYAFNSLIQENFPKLPILFIIEHDDHSVRFKHITNDQYLVIRQPITQAILSDQLQKIKQ